ncbi:uncharacterized protein LOC124816365 [Hydra vulgaris]|uniref:uncharacterized protein LOC124816365 n=1 Tax=Hydra vulgaris TaxID=6087 RepID=UPI001F5E48F2|nr:uncharacterized protein LOC124816365 [Hydra vulgaris]
MDDSNDSVETKEKAIKLYNQLTQLWKKAGMTARKWISNLKTVIECISIEARPAKINIKIENLPTVKILDVFWEAAEDMFTFSYTLPSKPVTSKRLLLKYISNLFDPLGFLSSFVIRAKILFQELWTLGEDKDEKLQEKNKTKGTLSSYVLSKTRVVPLNLVNIPRLELTSAVLGLKLALSVIEALPCTIKMENVTLVGYWRNPVYSNPKQWRYVPTGQNPADSSFRGVKINNLQKSNLWWTGHDFIQQEESQWPTKEFEEIEDKLILEVKNNFTLMTIKSKKNSDDRHLEPTRYLRWRKLKRVLAWVQRFQHNCFEKHLSSGTLSTEENNDAETKLIISAQKSIYTEEYNQLINNKEISKTSCLLKLSPRIDENKMLRYDSRLKMMSFSHSIQEYPIILLRHNHITKLIVKDCHEAGQHI